MPSIVYRYRTITALIIAVVICIGAAIVFPTVGANISRVTTAASMPGCNGTQNPFLGS
jgi:hypothetical protein